MARAGYTLPVFAVAAAKAALVHLLVQHDKGEHVSKVLLSDNKHEIVVSINLAPGEAEIAIQQVATIDSTTALGICLSDPGDNLDLTRNTPIWAWVNLEKTDNNDNLILEAGEGIGRTATGEPAFYAYAHKLFDINIRSLIPDQYQIRVRIILPEGRRLAQRTSNEAFGILEGLALLGTSGISQPHSSTDQLEEYRTSLQKAVQTTPHLVFCIGHNGQRTAQRLGLVAQLIVQSGIWLGPLLALAVFRLSESVLLLVYHGKLVKLAGGIFNTSSHVADGKLPILAAAIAQVDETSANHLAVIRAVLAAPTAAAAHELLIEAGLADSVFGLLARQISDRAQAYIQKYANVSVDVGTVLCDRKGNIIAQDTQLPSSYPSE